MDMLVTMAILGTIGAMAAPQLSTLSSSFNRLNARTILIQDLKRAQAQALTEGCRGIFTFDASNESYSFGCDYLSYDTSDTPVADTISFQRTMPDRTQVTVSTQVIFNSRGQSVDKDDIIQNVTLSLFDTTSGSAVLYNTGTLLGTGLFSFD